MIKIIINKNNQDVNDITISGHAMYDDYGKDIVCASVSSIVTTTVNGCLRINNNAISYKQGEGLVKINVLRKDEIINKLIINMLDLLKELSTNYPKNIKIIEEV